ncbi:MAG: dihydropteroate synthase [Coriobacteriia bacterium]|nr:dihydropteroate synthase [Coriobacteriia bacterium]
MKRVWRCGRFEMPLGDTLVMGIINVTPDSFSDGGEHADTDAAIAHGRLMVADGAAIIDVGGESTRPGAAELSEAEETARVLPVISQLAEGASFPVSIDTRHAEVARCAVEAGASIVNDVGGFRDAGMAEFAASADVGVVIMHMLGEPGTMQEDPRYDDVVGEVRDFLLDRALSLEGAGVARERICIDPGIGFGKTLEHNLLLLGALPELSSFGYPVLVGASRKRFIGMLGGAEEPRHRIGGSIAAAVWAAATGASAVRVHDVRETVEALRVASAIRDSSGR